jgi:hypothetical protein
MPYERENPLFVCASCDQLFSLSQVKGNPIDQRIQAVKDELLADARLQRNSKWCEEC